VAISRARVAARAVIRLATFAQAISSTNATKTPSAASERRFSFCKSETPVGAGSSTSLWFKKLSRPSRGTPTNPLTLSSSNARELASSFARTSAAATPGFS